MNLVVAESRFHGAPQCALGVVGQCICFIQEYDFKISFTQGRHAGKILHFMADDVYASFIAGVELDEVVSPCLAKDLFNDGN